MTLDALDRSRYARQIALFGEEGQERLKKARILIAGAGGLGSVTASYLGLSGIGFIRIADFDDIDESNLNRHLLADPCDVGKDKAALISERLSSLSPSCRVEALHLAIDDGNAARMASDVDLIVDALDNYPARHVLNRAASSRSIPLVHGAVRGFYGQAMTVIPGRGACLKCIFSEEFPRETFPILGATCGVIGSVQALEAVKYITGMGALLVGRLFVWDGRTTEAEIIEVRKNPACGVCGRKGGEAR